MTRGRPKLSDDVARREVISFRVTHEMRDKIYAMAAQSGRSVAQEVELRLELAERAEATLVNVARAFAAGLKDGSPTQSSISEAESRNGEGAAAVECSPRDLA